MRSVSIGIAAAIVVLSSGCATNPVTGSRELAIVSESEELHIGRTQYGNSRQMQGGDYTLDPELSAYVSSVGQKLAGVSDRALPYEFVVLNSSVPNAWALPGGKLAVNRGLLLELDNEAELAAVLGHEIVHAAARHGAKGMERGKLLQVGLLVTGIALSDHEYVNQIVGGAQLAAALLNQKYGRDAEREADRYGMKYLSRAGYDPKAAVTLQETFVRLSSDGRQDWLSGLFSSHPPSRERVEANREYARLLPAKGILGRERYQSAISGLVRTRDAYKAYDEGRTALQTGELRDAENLAGKALAIEPRESRFYALLGDIAYKEERYPIALDQYNEAVTRDSSFFYFYIQRGLTRLKLRDRSGAEQDLNRSLELLPTAVAHNALGDISRNRGDRRTAITHYRAAAGSASDTGRQAKQSLVKLDLPMNPHRYVEAQAAMDPSGYLVASVRNASPVTLTGIELRIRYRDEKGAVREARRSVSGSVAPETNARVHLGLGPFRDRTVLGTLQISIAAARAASE